jgi:hypothetical protein
MLDGLGRKRIGCEMELTEDAFAGYIKDIYRRFGVGLHGSFDEPAPRG